MGKTLTAANSVILFTVAGLFDSPVQLQGFSADDVYETDNIDSAEVAMGVDGFLSGGWIPKEVRQTYTLQADSDSNEFFETWYGEQEAQRELLIASGSTYLPAVERKYSMARGILMAHSPMAAAKKILQPRKYTVVWQRLSAAPI